MTSDDDDYTVYSGGTFDLLHAGHIDLLRVCRKLSGRHGSVVIALNTDEFITQFKGTPPVCSYEERRDVLEACRYVDEVIPNLAGQDSKPTIESVRPNFILIGDDWAKKDYYAQMMFTPQWLDERGITLLYVPRQRQLSSTQIKERTNGLMGPHPLSAEQTGSVASPARVTRTSA